MRRYRIALAVAILLLSGCVYYNTFFLAKKYFKEAESARERAGQEISKGGGKYQAAIEKASRVLEYYPDSKYVDDALYLIGRSFYHQGEFSKAETKFRELLATHPESEYAEESLFYLGKARYWKEDYVGAREAFVRIDTTTEDKELRSEAMFMMGELLYAQEEWDRAISVYQEYLDRYSKGERSGETKFKIATAYRNREDYRQAKDAFLEVDRLKADDSLKFQALFNAGECFYLVEESDSGLAIFTDLADDEKNYDHMADIYLQIARGEGLRGDFDAAMEKYNSIIEEFPGTEQAAVAFYHLGAIYQDHLYDLETAKAMYDSSTSASRVSPVSKLAISKSADIAKLETYREGKSAETVSDAVESQYLLAELYLVQLEQPDSALKEFQTLVDSFPESKYAPKALLSIGWVMENLRDDTSQAEGYYRRVLDEYPGSDLVVDAMEKLGIDPDSTEYDYPARRYREAERLLFTGRDYRAANELFQSIVDDFPESEYAPKASLAIAWSLSNNYRLPPPDSTDSGDVLIDSTYILAYKRVTDLYGGTEYGKLARNLLAGQGAPRPKPREPQKETKADTLLEEQEEQIDSLAIQDSIAGAVQEEIRQLERAPENPSFEQQFEYPLSAYNIPIEEQEQLTVKFKVRIDFMGEVTEWKILIGSGYDDIDRAAEEVIKEAKFDITQIDTEFYDSWFYYEYQVPRRTDR